MIKARRKITIRDVADLVDVHHSTVSRALSPTKRDQISPAVVKKVERAAKELGYYPNIVASSLKQNRSFAIGVLIPDLMNPVFPPIIRGIQDIAEERGYTVITANTDDEEVKERDALRMMQGRSIEGVIIATARRTDPIVKECIENEIPFVLVNRTVDHPVITAPGLCRTICTVTICDLTWSRQRTNSRSKKAPVQSESCSIETIVLPRSWLAMICWLLVAWMR